MGFDSSDTPKILEKRRPPSVIGIPEILEIGKVNSVPETGLCDELEAGIGGSKDASVRHTRQTDVALTDLVH